MQKAFSFLMFSGKNFGKAEEAIRFYTSLFDNSEVGNISYFKEGEEGGKSGTIKQADFTVAGQNFMALDSIIDHAFNFTPSISIFVNFDVEGEMENAFKKLLEGGFELMPMGAYGFSKKYGWVQDKYGITWQLNLPS